MDPLTHNSTPKAEYSANDGFDLQPVAGRVCGSRVSALAIGHAGVLHLVVRVVVGDHGLLSGLVVGPGATSGGSRGWGHVLDQQEGKQHSHKNPSV